MGLTQSNSGLFRAPGFIVSPVGKRERRGGEEKGRRGKGNRKGKERKGGIKRNTKSSEER